MMLKRLYLEERNVRVLQCFATTGPIFLSEVGQFVQGLLTLREGFCSVKPQRIRQKLVNIFAVLYGQVTRF